VRFRVRASQLANQGDTANILMHLRPPDDHFDDASKVFGKFDHRADSSQGQRTHHSSAHHWFLISANLAAAVLAVGQDRLLRAGPERAAGVGPEAGARATTLGVHFVLVNLSQH
jgi:hypothetical protein